jgi:murein DD-endopeptidase MepM/ murein hydrolase activator NlpD
MPLDSPGWTWPLPIAADGRRPRISDGFHARGDMRHRGGVGHRGQDIMYRHLVPLRRPRHPRESRWYDVPERTPALAAHTGTVYRCGRHATGWHVILQHADGIGTGYHHLAELAPGVAEGWSFDAGAVLGLVGGSPTGYGLVHLHFDLAVEGRFVDASALMARWRYLTLAAAWGTIGRVG